ncbi:hypothetical protein AAH995_26870 [Pseudomonas putida]|uniref:hypothetical protein n=1 Tax=Pseudomonas TaxID=286 RepID=UPI000AAC359E|nr:hypothetical protein [Pseudomonas putida]
MKRERKTVTPDKGCSPQASNLKETPVSNALDTVQPDSRLGKLWAFASPDVPVHDQRVRQALDYLVVQATKMPLEKVDRAVAETFALLFWYKNEDMHQAVEDRLKTPGLAAVRKRRLMYLVDRLRRFPCMKPERADQMKKLVAKWQGLSRNVNEKLVARAQQLNRYDKVAVAWGVAEPVGHLMSMVLELQTRHFVDAHQLPNGYAKLATRQSVSHQ